MDTVLAFGIAICPPLAKATAASFAVMGLANGTIPVHISQDDALVNFPLLK
jgi:hypothetical protein